MEKKTFSGQSISLSGKLLPIEYFSKTARLVTRGSFPVIVLRRHFVSATKHRFYTSLLFSDARLSSQEIKF